MTWKSVNGATPKAGSNYPIAKKGHDQWAFYGDGYDFQVRLAALCQHCREQVFDWYNGNGSI